MPFLALAAIRRSPTYSAGKQRTYQTEYIPPDLASAWSTSRFRQSLIYLRFTDQVRSAPDHTCSQVVGQNRTQMVTRNPTDKAIIKLLKKVERAKKRN